MVVEEEPGHVDQGVAPPPGGQALEVVHLGQPQRGGQHLAAFDVERAVEHEAAVEGARQVHGPLGLGRLSTFVEQCLGPGLPQPHGRGGVGHRQRRQCRHQRLLLLGEQLRGAAVDVGHHGGNLPARQLAPTHAADVTGSSRNLEAVRTTALALDCVMPARSRNQATADVAPSTSHSPAASSSPTASDALATNRSIKEKTWLRYFRNVIVTVLTDPSPKSTRNWCTPSLRPLVARLKM